MRNVFLVLIMLRLERSCFSLLSRFCFFVCVVSSSVKRKQQVLLISLDGFRWDYMSKARTPNLDYIVETGVKADFLRSAFPTTTYPNHVTMVTGLYPESHGIIANYMYDPKLGKRFDIYNTDPEWWHNAVPLWITNQNQGGRSGVIHWPGYNVAFNGEYADLKIDSPSYNIDLRNQSGTVISYKDRVDKLMEWFTSEKPPNFVALYIEEPDEEGHLYGPNSPQIKMKIEKLDETIGLILDGLRENSLLDSINIIVTSDHGMAEMSPFRRIFFDEHVDLNTFDIWDASTNLMISPKKGRKKKVYRAFKKLESEIPHIKVYWKRNIPDFLHFKNNRRVPKIFVLADLGWALVKSNQKDFNKGNHGFSPEYKSMGGLFIGRGPAFREGYTRKEFDNVHLYPLMCRLLGVYPRPNNGSLDETEDMLKPTF